jgi:hypothetical protein
MIGEKIQIAAKNQDGVRWTIKIQNGGLFEDDVIFEKKSTFFKRVVPTLNANFFKSEKNKSVVQRPKI